MFKFWTRAEMEIAILEHEIMDVNSTEGIEEIEKMSDEDMREELRKWVEVGDETT